MPAARPSRRQAAALLAVLALVAGTVVAVSYLVRPDRARSFDLFHGSVFLADSVAPVGVDLASGRPTVRLVDANAQVGASSSSDLTVTPLSQGTLLLNRVSGEFNVVAATGFVVKTNGGVPIAARAGSTGVIAIGSGNLAYLEQTGPTGTSVYLVGQTTVETASNVAAKVRPRAFRSMTEAGSTDPGAATSADGSLWLLLGDGSSRVLRRLDVPPGSSAGATLRSTDHGRVVGPAALATASVATSDSTSGATSDSASGATSDSTSGATSDSTSGATSDSTSGATSDSTSGATADSTSGATADPAAGTEVVGVASADRIEVLRGSTTVGTARFPAIAGLDRVLPAADGQGRVAFLFHGRAGWSLASLGADGRGLQGPTRLGGLSADATLTAPAASGGALYTMDTAGGQLLRIGSDGAVGAIGGARTYPLAEQGGRVVEPGGFGDGYVIARGSRVIYNSPTHLNALVVFTDGSHAPLTIEKSSAVAVSAAGGAESLTQSRVNAAAGAPRRTPTTPTTQPKASNPVNNKIDCQTVRQKPHIPTIATATPGSRSVALSWTYPLLSPQDCAPSTYQVNVTLLSADAPSPPSTVRVQGQQSVNLAGLFPSTQYEITVGAFINGQGTDSAPRRITTGPEGPAAPSAVTAGTDADGNWNITWSSCGSAQKGCVPASTWTVIPQFCDGVGLSGAPSPITVTADPTSLAQPPAQLQGGDALLGRGLRFQVQGTGALGTVGTPSGSTACTYSWSPPVASALTLSASQPSTTQLGGSTSTTVSLNLGSNGVHDVGGVGAQVTFGLTGPDGTTTKGPVTVTGASTNLSVTFDGVQAGAAYTASARVAPPRHAEASVTVPSVDVTTRSDWPTLPVDASCPSNGLLSCGLSVRVGAVSSAAARGETFDLASGSEVRCANTSTPLQRTDFDPSQTTITASLSQLAGYYGTCQVTVALVESTDAASPKVFGGTTSPATTVSVNLGAPAAAGAGADQFSASWNDDDSVHVHYSGSADLGRLTQNWIETISAPNGTACGSGAAQPDTDVAADPTCVNRFGDQGTGWSIAVSYQDRTDNTQHGPYRLTLAGAPPGYQPCAPAGLAASWNGTHAQGIHVATGSDATAIAGCSSWTYTIDDGAGSQVCQTSTDATNATHPAPPTDLGLALCGTPAADGWTVTITWNDTAGDPQTQGPLPVSGDPPKL